MKVKLKVTQNNNCQNNNKILLVEDGSVDIDKLERDGFCVIVYRQGSKPPMLLKWRRLGYEIKIA